MTTTSLAAAQRYIEADLAVLPVWWPTSDGRCACGRSCNSPCKHPVSDAVRHGLKDATTDQGVAADWWARWPRAGVAVVTGARWGIVVVDVDPEGLPAWHELEDRYGHIATLTAKTGRGGLHVVCKAPIDVVIKNSTGRVAVGIDARGEDGYVLVEPSRNLAGPYVWEDFDLGCDDLRAAITEAPAWLIARLIDREVATTTHGPGLNGELDGVSEGQRNAVAARLCGHLFARGLDLKVAWLTLQGWNKQNRPPMPEAELRKVAESLWRTDARNHPERAKERAELAKVEEDVDAALAKFKGAEADQAQRHELEQRRLADGLNLGPQPAGAANADKDARRQHVAHLRGWLSGLPIDRSLRSGREDAQYVLVTDGGERVPIGGVGVVLSPQLFRKVLYERFGLAIPSTTAKQWEKVAASLHAILEVEDEGFSVADEIVESIMRYAADNHIVEEHDGAATPEEKEKRRRAAIVCGQPFADDHHIYFQTGGLKSWLDQQGDRRTMSDVKRILRSAGFHSERFTARTNGHQCFHYYWRIVREPLMTSMLEGDVRNHNDVIA